jgi:hypothetical protein
MQKIGKTWQVRTSARKKMQIDKKYSKEELFDGKGPKR